MDLWTPEAVERWLRLRFHKQWDGQGEQARRQGERVSYVHDRSLMISGLAGTGSQHSDAWMEDLK
jgi:hypothetical protein